MIQPVQRFRVRCLQVPYNEFNETELCDCIGKDKNIWYKRLNLLGCEDCKHIYDEKITITLNSRRKVRKFKPPVQRLKPYRHKDGDGFILDNQNKVLTCVLCN